MAIDFPDSGAVYVKWTAPAGVVGLTTKTIMAWYLPDATPVASLFTIFDGTGTDSDEYNEVLHNAAGRFGLIAHFSTTNGSWITTSAAVTIGAVNHIAITYNGSSTANDPILYLNGVSAAVTESVTPVGTYRSGTSTDVYLASPTSGANPDGRILALCYYNRILTATEIADAYASRKAIPTYQGLVFAPNLLGAAGLQTFDGTTLAGANTIVDNISGAIGTPTGSPVGRGDIYLNY